MRFWVLSDIDPAKFLAIRKTVDKFRTDHPGVKTEIQVKTRRSIWESIFLHLRDKTQYPMADVMEIPHSWTQVLANLKVIREISDLIDGADAAGFWDFLRDGMVVNPRNDFFSFPWWMELHSLTYRDDMFRHFSDPAGQLKTWEGFVEACEFLKKKMRREDFYPLENSNPSGAFSLYDVLPCVWNRGGSLFNDEFTKSEIGKIEVQRGIQDFAGLARRGFLPLFKENYYETKGLLSEGMRAMIFGGRIPACFNRKNAVKLTPVPYPGESRKGHFVSSVNLAVSRDAGETQTRLFLKTLLAGPNLKFLAESFNVFPCLKSLLEPCLKLKKYGIYGEMIREPRMTPNISIFPTCESLLNNLLKETAVKIARGTYEEDDLRKKLIIIQTEVDYILSSY